MLVYRLELWMTSGGIVLGYQRNFWICVWIWVMTLGSMVAGSQTVGAMSLEDTGEPANLNRIMTPRKDVLQVHVRGKFNMGISGRLTSGDSGYSGRLKDESGLVVEVDFDGSRVVDASGSLNVKAPDLHRFTADTSAGINLKYTPEKRFSLEAGYRIKNVLEDEGEGDCINLQRAQSLKMRWEPVPKSLYITCTFKSDDSLYDSKPYRDYNTREIALGLTARPANIASIYRVTGDFSKIEKRFYENTLSDSITELVAVSARSPYRRRIGGGIEIERLFKNYINAPDKTYVRHLVSLEGEYRPTARLAIKGVLERTYRAFITAVDKSSSGGSIRVEISGKRPDNVAFEFIGEIGHVVFPHALEFESGTRLLSARAELPLGQGPVLSIKIGSQYKGYMDEELMDGNYDKRMLEIKFSEELDDSRKIVVEMGYSRKVYVHDPSCGDDTATTFGLSFTQEFD
ncbi:MAG TPA: hypothetical protein GXX51_08155 [Firmicutes bacterium]|nr:hypothetical protein [Bacillota bacterium]